VKFALAAVLVVGCSSEPTASGPETKNPPSAADKLTGNVAVGGEPATLTQCVPGHRERVFVEVVTSKGTLRYENTSLYLGGVLLECKRLDRSWGGGIRSNGTAYWRGTLDFQCTSGATPVVGKLDLDCGQITPEERAQLDQNRSDMKSQPQ
jgi:hypothetical protein